MKKILMFFIIILFISFSYLKAGDMWLHMLTSGTPIGNYYLGDHLDGEDGTGSWYIVFEINYDSNWDQTDSGIGQSNSDPSGWTWRAANTYSKNSNVRSDFGDLQFTDTGNWYINGRGKGDSGDDWHYANTTTWGNSSSFSPSYYFSVLALNDPSNLSITNNETNPNTQMDLSWSQDGQNHYVLIVRRTGQAVSWSPEQGTDYSDWQVLGDDTVIIRGSEASTSITDNNNGGGLDPNNTYYYKIYSENFQYYSSGITGNQQTLPVVLATFTAQYVNNLAQLYWRTQTETDNIGWNVYRANSDDYSTSEQINGSLIDGYGTTTEPHDYTYADNTLQPQAGSYYYYWIENIDLSGQTTINGPTELYITPGSEPGNNTAPAQEHDGLYDVKNNPFQPGVEATEISFKLQQKSAVDLSVFNIKGQLVRELYNGFATGKDLTWDGKDDAGKLQQAGVYLYRLQVNDKVYDTQKVILVR